MKDYASKQTAEETGLQMLTSSIAIAESLKRENCRHLKKNSMAKSMFGLTRQCLRHFTIMDMISSSRE